MRMLACALVLASASAFACPDLSGHWARCTSTSGNPGSSDVIVQQTISGDGITTYSMTSTDDESQERTTDSLTANGIEVVTTDEGSDDPSTTTATTASCEGGTALIIDSKVSLMGQPMGTITMRVTKEDGKLISRTSGNIFGQDISDVNTCQ